MIIVTGSAGFIGSNLISKLNNQGYNDVIPVDDFSNQNKNLNFVDKSYPQKVHRDNFFEWIAKKHAQVEFIFHIGARTDTAEFDKSIFDRLNVSYSQNIWKACVEYNIPLIYASSAATYGLGEFGYNDDEQIIDKLQPLNPYGVSKNDFDKWVLCQNKKPPFWAGMKFFNVYGPNEFHKGRMASVIFHAFNQIKATNKMKLFRSHNPDYKDGEQIRDFIYVKDVVDVLYFLMQQQNQSGIYNLGTGTARTFLDLTKSTFKAMNIDQNISFIDTPIDIRDKYQYFTEAKMTKLIDAGYNKAFHSIEAGVEDYVKNYLIPHKYQ